VLWYKEADGTLLICCWQKIAKQKRFLET